MNSRAPRRGKDGWRRLRRIGIAAPLGAALAFSSACGGNKGDGLDVRSMPPAVVADYELFAIRCSKCHSLARPLGSGITEDAYWAKYVERMRRQPGSGISPADVPTILRFLHYYSQEQIKKRGGE